MQFLNRLRTLTALLVAGVPFIANAQPDISLLDDAAKFSDKLVRVLAAHNKEVAAIKTLMDPIKNAGERYVKIALPSSMVTQASLEALQSNTKTLDSIGTSVPKPLSSPESMRSIGSPGVPSSNPAQLHRFEAAGVARETLIKKVKAQRDAFAKSVDQMKRDAATANTTAIKLEKLAGEPALEIIARFTGKSFVLSVFDYITAVVPALDRRVTAGEGALIRLDKTIKGMEADLATYRQMVSVIDWLFGDVSRLPGPRGPSAGSEQVSQVSLLAEKLHSSMSDANAQAQTLRDESKAIAERNATADGLSSLLALGSSALSLGNAAAGGGSAENLNDKAKPAGSPLPSENRTRIRLTAGGRAWVEVIPLSREGQRQKPATVLGPGL